MKKPMLWMVAGLAPFLLISPVSAKEPTAPVAEKVTAAKIPSLTYYYFDG
jgi:hypothetical protein